MRCNTLEDLDVDGASFDMNDFITRYELTETRASEDALTDQVEEERSGNPK